MKKNILIVIVIAILLLLTVIGTLLGPPSASFESGRKENEIGTR